MTAGVIMVAIALSMLVAFIVFYRYSRTAAWEHSDTRRAVLNVVIAVGPMLGLHYKPPRPPLPGITTPGPEQESAFEEEAGPDREDGSR